jgi:hypothetical protein
VQEDREVINANQFASIDSPTLASPGEVEVVPEGIESPADAAPAPILATSDELYRQLDKAVRENPRDTRAQLDLQLLLMLQDQQTPNLPLMAGLPQEDRELVTAVLDGLNNFRSTLRSDNNLLLSRKIEPLLRSADRLRAQAELSIPTLVLCRKVEGFGVYEPIEPARFIAGQEHPVIVYCEVANFSSITNAQERWETRLTEEAVLYTETGLPVWQDKPRTVVDVSRNRRHDFFLVRMIKLPANLTIGRYLLKVSITDEQARRVAEATLSIAVVAQ